MKLFIAILMLVGAYMYMLMHTTDLVLAQTEQLSNTYQHIADYDPQP